MYIPKDLVKLAIVPEEVLRVISVTTPASTWKDNSIVNSLERPDNLTFGSKSVYLRGIPLTPEILETSGWKTQNKQYYYLDVNKGFISSIGIDFKDRTSENSLRVEVDGRNVIEVRYCHELQHFLFGLKLNSELKYEK